MIVDKVDQGCYCTKCQKSFSDFLNVDTECLKGTCKRIRKKKIMTARDYELLALSRMTGEQIAMELTSEEKDAYYKLMESGN